MNSIADDIKHPALGQLWQYWLGKRGDRAMPQPNDIDPLELKFIIGELMLIDVSHDPVELNVRLHGSKLAEHLGTDLTGKSPDQDDVIPEFGKVAVDDFVRVVEDAAPFHRADEIYLDDRLWRLEGLALPLSADGRRVDRLLIGIIYET